MAYFLDHHSLLSEAEATSPSSPTFHDANPMVSEIASLIVSANNEDVNHMQDCSKVDWVELWRELVELKPPATIASVVSPNYLDNKAFLFSESDIWPSGFMSSGLVQSLEAGHENSEQFLCPRPNDCAPPPLLDAILLRQLQLEQARPNTPTLAPPPANKILTSVPNASPPFTRGSTKRKWHVSNGLNCFSLGHPASKLLSAGADDCSIHVRPPGNIATATRAPPFQISVPSKQALKPQARSVAAPDGLRRKNMTRLFSTLRTLLPNDSPKKDQCLIIKEACDYIHSLEKRLQVLKMKMHILTSVLSQTNVRCSQLPQEAGDDEISAQVQISVIKDHDMIYITIGCLERISGLLCNILSILEQHGLHVTSANVSHSEVAIVYVFHVLNLRKR